MEVRSESEATAVLSISRTADYDIKMRGLEVFIDGEFVHDLAYPKTWTTHLAPGVHTVKVSNHLYKQSLEIQATAGKQLELLAGNRFTLAGGMMVSVLGMGPYRVFLTEMPVTTDK